ncbi:MAG: hypothetical protein ACYCW6_30245 [Candidatus Xenobia bacterium]
MNRALALVLLCAAVCTTMCRADVPAAQKAIQMLYDKACEAVAMKFVDGVQAIRAPGYAAYGPGGHRLDGGDDWSTYQKVLAPAIQVKETVEILGFHQSDANHATCRVHDELEVVTAPRPRVKSTLLVDTDSVDDWVLTSAGWRVASSRIRQRKVRRQAPQRPQA